MEPREARDADVARLRAERDRLWAELETANGNLVGGSATEVAKVDGWPRWRNKLRLLMRFPSSSRAAFALGVWSVASILLFVVIMIVTSQPHYRADGYEDLKQVTWWISFGIQVSFLVEMLLNWLVMRNRAEFLSFVSLLDIATIVPFWIGIFVMVGYHASPIGIALTGLTLLRVLRLLRVAKIFRTRRSGRIVLLAQAVKESSFGILALVVIFPLIALFFGISVYYAESASCYADPKTGLWIYAYPPNTGIESKFQSIDIALWFMFVTLTTTGYGDIVPLTTQSRFITSIAMLTALFMLAMPLTIITNSYGRVIDRFNAQTEEIRNLKMKIRMLDFRICELEGTIYVDPFKGRGRGEGKFGQWIKRIKDKIYGEEKTRRPSISTVVGKVPTAAELVDPDAEKEGLDGDPDVAGNQGETSTEELLHQMRELLVLRSQDEARAKRIEEAVEKILDIMAVGQPPSS